MEKCHKTNFALQTDLLKKSWNNGNAGAFSKSEIISNTTRWGNVVPQVLLVLLIGSEKNVPRAMPYVNGHDSIFFVKCFYWSSSEIYTHLYRNKWDNVTKHIKGWKIITAILKVVLYNLKI